MGLKMGTTNVGGVRFVHGGYTIDDIATGNIVGDVVITASSLRTGSFKNCTGITSFTANNVTNLNNSRGFETLQGCTSMVSLTMENLTSIASSNNFAKDCTSLIYIHLPKIVDCGNGAFINCTSLKTVVLESAVGAYNAFNGCTNLEIVDFAGLTATATINQTCFNACTKFKKLIIRKNAVIGLSNTNAFTNSPFASGKSGGTLYVPRAQVDNYKSATNWITILGYANNSIEAIEDSIYATQYANGTPISS